MVSSAWRLHGGTTAGRVRKQPGRRKRRPHFPCEPTHVATARLRRACLVTCGLRPHAPSRCVFVSAYTCIYNIIYVNVYIIHTHRDTQLYACACARTHTYKCAHTHKHTRYNALARKPLDTCESLLHAHIRNHCSTHAHTHMHTKHTNTHRREVKQARGPARACICARKQAFAHTVPRRHTHTHTNKPEYDTHMFA